jgi:hypothetical protein
VVAEGKAKEIEIAVEEIGSRLKGSSLRAKVKMAEQVEVVLKELEEAKGMKALARARVLGALAVVCERLHRWSSEPTGEELERMKNAAINISLIRTSPEQLRLKARANGVAKP